MLGRGDPDAAPGRSAHPGARPTRLLARRPRPQDVSAYRVSALADDVLAVLDAAGVRSAHVVGHDWGGAVAWYLGAHHSERVDSLTVLSTPHPERAGPCR